MLTLLSVELAGVLALAPALPQEAVEATAPARTIRLGEPQLLMAGGKPILTETPGYASPAWHDVDGDGRDDLVVGQFAGGKLQVFRSTADGFAPGTWIHAGGDVAEVPGVW